jgi:hypothetical protein
MITNIVSGLDANAATIRNVLTTVAPKLNQTMTGNTTVTPNTNHTTPEGICSDLGEGVKFTDLRCRLDSVNNSKKNVIFRYSKNLILINFFTVKVSGYDVDKF